MHVEKVENHDREDGVPGDEGEIRFQVSRVDGRIMTVEAEPEGQKVREVDHRDVIDDGEEGDDLPMLDFFQDASPPSKQC